MEVTVNIVQAMMAGVFSAMFILGGMLYGKRLNRRLVRKTDGQQGVQVSVINVRNLKETTIRLRSIPRRGDFISSIHLELIRENGIDTFGSWIVQSVIFIEQGSEVSDVEVYVNNVSI